MHHGNRHGRSEQARDAVLQAADDLLAERGLAGVTIEGIAARAGVAKQTIYRWWSSKVDILIDAFTEDAADHLTPPDHGDLARDLADHLHTLALFLTESDPGAVFRALAGQAQHDPAIAARFRTECVPPLRAQTRLPFERALARGDLPPGLDIDTAADQVVGPIHYRVLVTGEPVPRDFTERLVADWLAAHT